MQEVIRINSAEVERKPQLLWGWKHKEECNFEATQNQRAISYMKGNGKKKITFPKILLYEHAHKETEFNERK